MSRFNANVVSFFDVGDDCIRVEASILTGMEWVYLNDQLVSKKLSWRFKTVHRLSVKSRKVDVVVKLSGLLMSSVLVELWLDGGLKDTDEWNLSRLTGSRSGTVLGLIFLLFFSGVGLGLLGYFLATQLYGG